MDLRTRTKDFALRIIRMYVALPKREADCARSRAEFLAKMGESLKELSETTYWLELLGDAELVKPIRLQPLLTETQELTAIFASIIKTTRAKAS